MPAPGSRSSSPEKRAYDEYRNSGDEVEDGDDEVNDSEQVENQDSDCDGEENVSGSSSDLSKLPSKLYPNIDEELKEIAAGKGQKKKIVEASTPSPRVSHKQTVHTNYARPSIHSQNEIPQEQDTIWACMTSVWDVLQSYGLWCILFGIFGVFLSALYMNLYMNPQEPILSDVPQGIDSYKLFSEEILKLRNEKFSSQTLETWIAIKAGVRPVLTSTLPHSASVIMIASKDKIAANCLAKSVAKAAMTSMGKQDGKFIEVQASKYSKFTEEQIRLDVSSHLDELGTSPVAIVHDVHAFPKGSSMILFGYCDDQDAIFKDAIILLTSQLDAAASAALKSDNSNCETVVNEFLTRMLERGNYIPEDKIPPFQLRISQSVVCAGKEENLGENEC